MPNQEVPHQIHDFIQAATTQKAAYRRATATPSATVELCPVGVLRELSVYVVPEIRHVYAELVPVLTFTIKVF